MVDVGCALCFLIGSLLSIIILGLIIVYVTSTSQPDDTWFDSEQYFKDPKNDDTLCPFPRLEDPATRSLSVIVPAYDEEQRLPPMLDECIKFLEERKQSDHLFTYEVILVDDGSKDKTTDLGLKYGRKWGVDKVRVLTLAKNRGKGGAVRQGIMRSRGRHLLFADADGATKFADLVKLENYICKLTTEAENESAIVVGSRAHLEKDSIAKRSFFRTFLMFGFHLMVWLFCVRTVRDTQCGFKLFTRAAARVCFPSLHINRWAFDVELLYIAETLRIPIGEVSVTWTEIDGSKVVPFWSWLQMGRDLLLLWLRYTIKVWQIDDKKKN